jgi:hypothetical protein
MYISIDECVYRSVGIGRYSDGLRAGLLGFNSSQRQDISLLHSVQTGSGTHPSSYAMGTGGFFPRGVKQSGRETDHSPPSSAEDKNDGALSPLPDISESESESLYD